MFTYLIEIVNTTKNIIEFEVEAVSAEKAQTRVLNWLENNFQYECFGYSFGEIKQI